MNRNTVGQVQKGSGAFAGDDKGVTAIEFALIAPLFFALIFAVIEFGMLYHTNSQLERAAFTAQKKLVFKNGRPESAEAVRSHICEQAALDCKEAKLVVQVAPLTATQPAAGALTKDSFAFAPGKPNVVRVSYPWPNPVPAGVLSILGLEDLQTINLQAAIFFHPDE